MPGPGRHRCQRRRRLRGVELVAAFQTTGFLLGLLIGSFLNVVAYRVPIGKSIVHPGSACPACDKPIRPRDNIPVLSWVVLRGRCRDCGATISARYPVVEAATAILFVAAVAIVGARWVLPAYWWFTAVAVALVLTDLDHKRIPNRILFPGIAGGSILLFIGAVTDGAGNDGGFAALGRAGLGAAAYFGFLFVLALVARGGFGFGDVKLAILLGLFLAYQSWGVLFAGIMLAFLIGGVVALGLLASRRVGRRTAIPFGPALVAGAFVALAAGDALVDWYLAV